ncbi:MAG: 50S ribosomal protein L21 [Clostridia bacterium]|nr:50S ribosomal protein L21 [Clostridia bacterium]
MYAIIKTGGKQYKAEPEKFIDVEKLDAEVGAEVSFDALMVVDGENVTIGAPVVEGVKVCGKVLAQDKAKKVVVYKYKPKKNAKRKMGHRQPYTKVEISAINA